MATDYGFNSDSHAHTNGDMTDGESALASSNDATHQLNGAQTDTRWTSEQGPRSFRSSTIAFFGSVDEMLADEQDVFDTFRTNLSIAEQEAPGRPLNGGGRGPRVVRSFRGFGGQLLRRWCRDAQRPARRRTHPRRRDARVLSV